MGLVKDTRREELIQGSGGSNLGLSEILCMGHNLVGRRWLWLDGNGQRRSRCPQG